MCVFDDGRQVVARRVRVELGKFNLKVTGYNVDQYQVIECVILFAKIDDECAPMIIGPSNNSPSSVRCIKLKT